MLLDEQALVEIMLNLVPSNEANARDFRQEDFRALEVCMPPLYPAALNPKPDP